MGVESADFIQELDDTWPLSSDGVTQGDDHLRVLKGAVKATFPDGDRPFYFPKGLVVATNYTLTDADAHMLLVVNANGGDINITLPDDLQTEDEGWDVVIVRNDDSANEVNILGTVSGFEDPVLIGQFTPLHIQFDGSQFRIIGEPNIDVETEFDSGGPCPIGRAPSKMIVITGGSNITSFGKSMAGVVRFIRFTGNAKIKHDNTATRTITCLGGADHQMADNANAMVYCIGGERWVVVYARDLHGAAL